MKIRDSRLYDALDYLDEAYIAEVVENLKVPPAPGMPARKGGQLRYILALAACLLVLSAAIPVITYVMRNYADLPGWLISDTTENTSPELTEPETPPSETTAPPAPETSEDIDHETTAPLYDGTTAEPEPEYDGSRGLMYKMNDDGKSYYLAGMGICTDENIVVASTYDGYPVTKIGESALSGYDRVKSVTIPDSVTAIDHYAFMNCSSLENVTIHDKVTYIGAEAFSGTAIKNIKLPTGLTYLSIGAFKDCPIEEVVIPDSVEVINSAFWGCSELRSVTIGRNAAEIKTLAFYGCKKLTDLIFDGTVEEWNKIKKIQDWNAESVITVVHCTDGDVKIEPHQQPEPEYDGSQGLEYKISDDGTYAILVGIGTCTDKDIVTATTYNGLPVTSVDYSFSKISNITSITLSDSVLTIGGIDNMPDLVKVYFSKSVAFFECKSLTKVSYEGTMAEWKAIEKTAMWSDGAAFSVIHCSDGDAELIEYDGSRGLEYRIDGDHAVLVGIGTCTDKDIVTATKYCYMLRHNSGWVREIAVDGTFEWHEPGYSPSNNDVIGRLEFSGASCKIVEVYRKTNVGTVMEPNYEYYVNMRRVSEEEAKEFLSTLEIDLVCQYQIERYPLDASAQN